MLQALAPHEPFRTRHVAEKLDGDVATDVTADGNNGYGKPYGQDGFGRIAVDNSEGDIAEEEHVDKVHAKRLLRYVRDEFGHLMLADTREEQEQAERHHDEVGRAELPSPFEHRRFDGLHRFALHPERPTCEQGSNHSTQGSDAQALCTRPFDMHANVMCQDEVAQIARAIPQHREVVPEAFAPHLGIDETMNEGQERAGKKQIDEHTFVLCAGLLKPR